MFFQSVSRVFGLFHRCFHVVLWLAGRFRMGGWYSSLAMTWWKHISGTTRSEGPDLGPAMLRVTVWCVDTMRLRLYK